MFNRNKHKIDPRIRYRNSKFSRKLESARGYKRVIRQRPKSSWEVFLANVGLTSWQSKVITGAVFFLLIYLVYIPNFLFIKQVTVNGSDQPTNAVVKSLTDSYLDKKLPWPQRSLSRFLRHFIKPNAPTTLSTKSKNSINNRYSPPNKSLI